MNWRKKCRASGANYRAGVGCESPCLPRLALICLAWSFLIEMIAITSRHQSRMLAGTLGDLRSGDYCGHPFAAQIGAHFMF